tara:strand:+ start:565 stop:1053 length:489 start_codon:yes stop_codon:yes gene_type:complete
MKKFSTIIFLCSLFIPNLANTNEIDLNSKKDYENLKFVKLFCYGTGNIPKYPQTHRYIILPQPLDRPDAVLHIKDKNILVGFDKDVSTSFKITWINDKYIIALNSFEEAKETNKGIQLQINRFTGLINFVSFKFENYDDAKTTYYDDYKKIMGDFKCYTQKF